MTKIALITGAGTGIGEASAQALAKAGFTVVLTGRRKDALEKAANKIGAGALAVPADVGDPASVEALFGEVKAKLGRLDVLFNNAGTGAPALPLEDLSFAQWKQVVDTNLTGTFLCTQAAFRIMKAQDPRGGRIINNGSISAQRPRAHAAPYTATKHGVAGLTQATALEGRKYDITCSQIDIGNAGTRMTQRMTTGVIQSDFSLRPEPVFDVKHVADAVVYIANLPLDTNVLSMTILASKMPFVGRG